MFEGSINPIARISPGGRQVLIARACLERIGPPPWSEETLFSEAIARFGSGPIPAGMPCSAARLAAMICSVASGATMFNDR